MNADLRKLLIRVTAAKLGCVVEQIDLRSSWVRLRREGKMILVHLWRGISAENIVSQMESYIQAT